jgi:elongation factor P--(R)-beta-lysine ligase
MLATSGASSPRGVLEVSDATDHPAGITDIHIESLALADGRFLRTSPEYQHKRLLAAGFPDLYELGPVFRAEEHGRFHRTEFWLLEWYRVGWTWQALAGKSSPDPGLPGRSGSTGCKT